MTLSVAHLSDPHITTGPGAAAPAARLRAALGRVLALDPLPDCAVITGDLTELVSTRRCARRSMRSRCPCIW